MLKQTALRTAPLALVLLLGACSWLQQPAAPVVAGTAGGAKPAGSVQTQGAGAAGSGAGDALEAPPPQALASKVAESGSASKGRPNRRWESMATPGELVIQ